MKNFPALAPLEFAAIDIHGELVTTPRMNKYVLVISDRFIKHDRTVLLRAITAGAVARVFVTHWATGYGPLRQLLSGNEEQFTSEILQHTCMIQRIYNVFAMTYHLQTSGQAERYNATINGSLQYYVKQHLSG